MNEIELSGVLGVARKRLSSLRKDSLVEGEDWDMVKRRVVYTAEGIMKVRKALDLPEISTPEKRQVARHRVVGKLPQNLRLVHTVLVDCEDNNPPVQRVRVSKNVNFMKGMEFDAVRLSGNLWAIKGRCPRFRGRW